MSNTIGFIGLGVMGQPMASHLLDAGCQLCVYNRTRAKARALEEKGAIWCTSPAEVAAQSSITFTIVGYPADVEEVYQTSEKSILKIVHKFADPKPFVIDTVGYLRDHGIKIGSTTGYTDEMMDIVVPEAAKKGYSPDCWFSPNSVGNFGRPYPYMIFENLKALHK